MMHMNMDLDPTHLPTSLMHLPDELLLEVLSNFNCIRSFESQSQAFKNKEKEKARQCENHARQVSLHALASTNRRMNGIATPILYSSFVGSATWHGFQPLRLFHRTVTTENGKLLARNVTYLENRLSDFLGNGLYDDMEFYGAVEMVSEYFYLLAAIIREVPNLQHLSVVSLESEDVSLWNFLLPSTSKTGNFWSRPTLSNIADHGLQKLETLCLQIHTEGFGLEPDSAWFRRICSAMTDIQTLKELRASGVITSGTPSPLPRSFKDLQHLEITECVLDFDEVLQLLQACQELKHFGCQWAFLNCGGETPSDLYPGLVRHMKSLESLILDTREVRFNDTPTTLVEPLGSLRDFDSLKSVDICESSLLANKLTLLDFPDQKLQFRIAELLPPSLEYLTIRVKSDWGYHYDCRIDEAFALWHLTEDCNTLLPNLKEVTIKSSYELSAPNLEAEFRHYGIKLNLVREKWHPFDD